MSTPPDVQPGMWYDATARDDNPNCVNYEKSFDCNPVYSNAGTIDIVCGLCSQPMTLLTATLLDPQPVFD